MTMSPSLRKFALAVHLTLSIGWIGAVAAYMALDVAAATSPDAQTLRSAYFGMDLIVRNVIVPLAFASLATGLVMALGTKWGLFRHYWVLISLVMTIIATVVLAVETRTISHLASIAADPSTPAGELQALGGTLVHSVGGAVVLIVILVLNIYKPQGHDAARVAQAARGANTTRRADDFRAVDSATHLPPRPIVSGGCEVCEPQQPFKGRRFAAQCSASRVCPPTLAR